MPSLAEAKAAIRTRMKELRAGLGAEERVRLAGEIEARLFSLPVVERATSIMLFASFGSEVPTAGMIERSLREGRRVLLPCLEEGEIHAAVAGAMVSSGHGPLEPAEGIEVQPSEIDVVVTPGLAFDHRGNRMGYGGGHYDRFLARFERTSIGIGFHVQMIESVPAGAEDRRVDVVVTDQETVICSGP